MPWSNAQAHANIRAPKSIGAVASSSSSSYCYTPAIGEGLPLSLYVYPNSSTKARFEHATTTCTAQLGELGLSYTLQRLLALSLMQETIKYLTRRARPRAVQKVPQETTA